MNTNCAKTNLQFYFLRSLALINCHLVNFVSCNKKRLQTYSRRAIELKFKSPFSD